MTVELRPRGGDVLEVVETNAAGEVTRLALGWMSALQNVVVDDERDENGNYVHDDPEDPRVNRRAMTEDEAKAYALGLLDELQAPAQDETPPKPILTF